MPTAQRGHGSIDVAAPPDLVYDLIADVTRMGQWSPECYRCEWLDGATAAAPGTRFRGYNRLGRYRWERTAIIDTADRGSEFTFTTTDDRTGRLETQWQYTMQPTPSGTLLTESFEFLWCSLRNRATEMFIPRGRQRAQPRQRRPGCGKTWDLLQPWPSSTRARTDHHLGYLVSRRDSQATIVAWKIYGRVKIGAG